MTVALIVQDVNTATSPSGVSATFAITSSTAGSLLVLVIHVQSSSTTVTGVTDSGGNTWTLAVDLSTSGSYTGIWYLANAPAGITSVTATESVGTAYSASVSQWSGVATSSPVRVTSFTNVTASPNRTGTVATVSGDLVVGGISANSATARTLVSAGWVALTQGTLPASFTAQQAYLVTGGGTDEGQWTTGSASNTGGVVAAFIPAAAGGPTVAPDGIAVPVALGSPSIADSALSVAPDGLSVPVALGSPSIADSALSVAPDGLSVPVALGSPSIADGAMATFPDGISVPVALGAPSLTWSATAAPDGITVPVAVGDPIVGASVIAPDGLTVPVALGAPALAWSTTATPDGISVPVAVGAPVVSTPGGITRRPDTGTITRPGTGITVRPYTGTTSRP